MGRILKGILGMCFSIFIIGCADSPAPSSGDTVGSTPGNGHLPGVSYTDGQHAERVRIKKENEELKKKLRNHR